MRRILTWSRGSRRSASMSTVRLSSTDTSETRRGKVRLLSLHRQRGTERVTATERERERERERESDRVGKKQFRMGAARRRMEHRGKIENL